MATITIRDTHSFLNEEHEGELISAVDTRSQDPDNPSKRWVEIKLYRLDDGSYLVHRIGQSVVYHTAGTTCLTSVGRQSGDPAKVDDLPDEAVPCETCRPPQPWTLDSDDPVRYEFPRHTIDTCSTPAEVIKRLTTMRERRTRRATTVVSEPVRELLGNAARTDGRFADAMASQPARTG